MPWWALVLLIVGVLGGIPNLAFVFLIVIERLREREAPDVELRAEALAQKYHPDAYHGCEPRVPRDRVRGHRA